jgi:uncharacterized protein
MRLRRATSFDIQDDPSEVVCHFLVGHTMRIWLDGDAVPRDVKELVYRASTRLGMEVILVANQSIWIPPGNPGVTCITVREGANIADKYIVEHVAENDIVVTADIPLAASLVGKSAWVIGPRGEEYDPANIASRLATRDLFDAARGAGIELPGPAPYRPKDRHAFAATLDRVITRAKKRAAR